MKTGLSGVTSSVKKSVTRKVTNIRIEWSKAFLMMICLGLIAISLKNIYGIVERGYQRYQFIQTENERFNELLEENTRLKDDLQYYSSYEYIEYKAREELNLVYPGSKLLYVDRGPADIERIELPGEEDQHETPSEPRIQRWIELILE